VIVDFAALFQIQTGVVQDQITSTNDKSPLPAGEGEGEGVPLVLQSPDSMV
jgi:hypothetical protein